MSRCPYITEDDIILETEALMAKYHARFPNAPTHPCPIEEILEALFGCAVQFFDFSQQPEYKNILGGLSCRKGQRPVVYVSEALNPDENPKAEGRYRYTLAHEVGHLVLHLDSFLEQTSNFPLFPEMPTQPVELYRSTPCGDPREIQANKFASNILMPHDLLLARWQKKYGENSGRKNVYDEIESRRTRFNLKYETVCADANSLAREFRVSGQAMQHRLEDLGFINTHKDLQGTFL